MKRTAMLALLAFPAFADHHCRPPSIECICSHVEVPANQGRWLADSIAELWALGG